MTSTSIVSWIRSRIQSIVSPRRGELREKRASLSVLYAEREQLPRFVQESAVAMRYLELLGPLAWEQLPARNLAWPAPGPVIPLPAFCAAYLVKLEQHLVSMGQLRTFLVEHPALLWVLGFHLTPSPRFAWGFDGNASLPTQRHLTRMLRSMPNSVCQILLDSTVSLLQAELSAHDICLGDAISLDTKHILAWVRENNPKEFVPQRFNKEKQPKGDPDCRLGFKARHNHSPRTDPTSSPPTPTQEGKPASQRKADGEYLWGYASGVVATKVPQWGEFVLAELTLPLNTPDAAYFFPLLEQVERRLGYKPRFAALDGAFDAFYIYEYFHASGGFAAVPWADRPSHRKSFSTAGLPLCAAGLPMPLKSTFHKRSACLVPHQCARYACPLLFPEPSGQSCPIHRSNWGKGGCLTTLPLSPGTQVRHELDRSSPAYKEIYRQRTATERINSQATALGIERPKLRNGQAIANLNSLLYVLINLRALHRIRSHSTLSDPQLQSR